MSKNRFFVFLLLFAAKLTYAQNASSSRLNVFIDCSAAWCDLQYIRSEITVVNFSLDNEAADVHVLITSQGTGSGGEQYQLIFFGQHRFKSKLDTLRFYTDRNASDFENRSALLQYLRAGLIPYIAKTASMNDVVFSLKHKDSLAAVRSDSVMLKDPWKAWVFRIGADANINADANYKNTSYSGNFSANKITVKLKTGVGVNWGKNKSVFRFQEDSTTQEFRVNNQNWSVNQYLVKSINSHWSWAYEIKYSQNTFSNNKGRYYLRPAIEYNVVPYEEVNNKLLTISYGLTGRLNNYFDTTIYDKQKETLFGHRATVYLSLNQKWGNSYTGISYHSYFHDFGLYNLGLDAYLNIRITGGLSVYLLAFGGLTRDQVFLVKGNATPEEVLARRRQLASGYNYYTSIGINFRFGSKLNNVVNPRFDRSSSSNEE